MAWEAFVCPIHRTKSLMWHQKKKKGSQEGLTLILPPETHFNSQVLCLSANHELASCSSKPLSSCTFLLLLQLGTTCSSPKFDVVAREGEERIVERKEISCKWFTRDRQLKFQKV